MSNEIQQFTGTALQVKNDFVDPIQKSIKDALPLFMRDESEAWIRSAVFEISKSEQLKQYAKNDFPSFAGTLTRAASYGLPLNQGLIYILPYRTRKGMTADVIKGWRGELELIYRAGKVETVHHEEIFENDRYEYRGGAPRLIAPAPEGQRGKIKYAVAWGVLKSGALTQFAVVDAARIEAAKNASASWKADMKYGTKSSPWHEHEVAMWRKTAVHELAGFTEWSVEECRPERLEAMKTRAALALDVEREKTARMEAENRAMELKIKLMELEANKKEEG